MQEEEGGYRLDLEAVAELGEGVRIELCARRRAFWREFGTPTPLCFAFS